MSDATEATIIILDDSETAIESAKAALHQAGYRVLSFTNPVTMVSMLFKEHPPLVLLDVNMPLLDGPTILQRIRSSKQLDDTMVVLHSDLPHAQLRSLAEKNNADGYIRKNPNGAMLVGQVRRLLAQKRITPAR
jgi:DNA-binding response OmpR family regulator